jgi:hypothetical protein
MKFKNKINKVNFSALVVLIALIILGVSFNVNAETNTWEQYGSQLLMANETESAFTFNPNTGEPYIIYSDGSVSNPASLSVKKFDGSSWEYVGAAGISSGVGLYPSIAFNPIDNQPYIAFSHSDGSGINVSRYDGSTWVSVGTVNASGDYPSIAFDSDNGYLYLAYEKNITEEVKVQRYTGSSWQDVGSTVSDGTGTYTSIAFDSLSDTVYVGYRDDVDASFTTTVKKYDFSGDWETVGVRGLSGIASRDEFSKNQKMYVDPLTGDPYIMYDYGNDPVHGVLAKFDGINWVDVGGGFYYYSTYSTSSVSQLAFSPLNDIYITHRGESSSNINKITKKLVGI